MNMLTMKDFVEAAKEYYDKGLLGFQNGKDRCLYDYGDGCVCAVGAALKKHGITVPEHRQTKKIIYLYDFTWLNGLSEAEIRDLIELQGAHDNVGEGRREEQVERFRLVLEELHARYC